ncbi:MAG: class I SAM-dependent methyltransferase [Clostridia bacterium]|nr:class I SAM-dependent methyltransferase [Clostridia bacterium]MBR7032235.1 class I SAM-dependent methyltransferase [Clostridia bacterium]
MKDIFKANGEIRVKNGVLQLSDAPDIVTDGDGDKYIGYEEIGEAYSGNAKHLIDEGSALTAEYIAEVTKDGLFLDLGCGDGAVTVPCARLGVRVIAGDISNKMMEILKERAKRNGISLESVTLCRMNALDIPLRDESVDTVVANSVLHLISNPEKVLREIYRVLKPGGRFVCRDDAPDMDRPGAEGFAEENEEYMKTVGEIYEGYWAELGKRGVTAKRYSWRFDRDAACRAMFGSVETKRIERGVPYFNRLVDSFLPRFAGKGFSDQVDVPADLHREVCDRVVGEVREKYGEKFDAVGYHGIEPDMIITSYVK